MMVTVLKVEVVVGVILSSRHRDALSSSFVG
jgi:hypothetical protein